MPSNPIQQRIELICEKWEEAKKNKEARIIHIRCQPDEPDMVDTFYTYMIGVDTPIMDIAFHFDSACTDPKLFSGYLLEELEEIMHIWNNSEKDPRIEYTPVHWQADRMLKNDKNTAGLFVHNFNSLAKEMNLQHGIHAVAILKGPKTVKLITWLNDAIETGISPAVKFLVHDTIDNPFFSDIISSHPSLITTIPLNLNMPKALEQAAAMGDPNDPATVYRQTFMKMMNEMGAGNENKAEKWGQECLKIASQNVSKDPYWITQLIVIYIALGNDKIRYKKKEATIEYANKAVETATASKEFFENGMASQLLAQALMFRGSVFYINEKKAEAFTDFSVAYDLYRKDGNILLAIESCRMAGESALKSGQKETAKILSEGARLGSLMDFETARSTTYAGILDLILKTDHSRFISTEELDEIAEPIYGADWRLVVKTWKQVPDNHKLKKQEMEAAETN